jgi:hypothetical protein
VLLSFDLRWEDWERLDAGGWMHLDDDVRGPVLGGELVAGEPVRIEARLGDDGRTLAAIVCEEPRDLPDLLREPCLTSLRRTEAWYAMSATQQRGRARVGLCTRWALVA